VSERDFAEFIRILRRHRARFLVIGGYAMAHHGLVRATNDVDVLIATDDANLSRVRAATREFVGVEPSDAALLISACAVREGACFEGLALEQRGNVGLALPTRLGRRARS
jgi:hypothetical protein